MKTLFNALRNSIFRIGHHQARDLALVTLGECKHSPALVGRHPTSTTAWTVTISNDYGESFTQHITARSRKAAEQEAQSMTDSDWYFYSVQPA